MWWNEWSSRHNIYQVGGPTWQQLQAEDAVDPGCDLSSSLHGSFWDCRNDGDSTYSSEYDCDDDGFLDIYCFNSDLGSGVLKSSENCASTWPMGTCDRMLPVRTDRTWQAWADENGVYTTRQIWSESDRTDYFCYEGMCHFTGFAIGEDCTRDLECAEGTPLLFWASIIIS